MYIYIYIYIKGYALCRRPPVNRKLVTGRTCNDKGMNTAVIYKPGGSILTSWRCNSERACKCSRGAPLPRF